MARRVHVEVKVKLILNMEEGIEVEEFIQEMNYDFSTYIEGIDIVDTEILEFEVTDSK